MFFKKKLQTHAYDKAAQKPVIRSSICTGEKVAGFQDLATGRFADVILIRSPEDLREFCRLYGVEEEELTTLY
ncbi:MAG TPA: aspartate dehydrogenase [Candidatus Gemmiger faecavium]|nr:aspartate dehydrogenase [Candidatus Gemmiger faecavium]